MKAGGIVLFTLLTATVALSQTIVCRPDAPANVKLAAKEIRRYVYLRTGELLQTKSAPSDRSDRTIRLVMDSSLAASKLPPEVRRQHAHHFRRQRYRRALRRLCLRGETRRAVLPARRCGSGRADSRSPFPDLDETRQPLFALRGVNPWGSHPFGFDAWGADDYKAIFTQLAKMRMNFLGIHCYPEGHPYAEPTVWHGLAGDFDAQGRVTVQLRVALLQHAAHAGLGRLPAEEDQRLQLRRRRCCSSDDDWAPAVMRGHCPLPQTPEACNEVFNRMAAQFQRRLHFRPATGREDLPRHRSAADPAEGGARAAASRARTRRSGRVREVYEGTFRRIMASHPLDYYWLWTPEGWTWEGNKPEQYSNTVADIRLAIEALKNVNAPFQLATSGWVLGPAHDRAAFDNDLPKDIPMSAISRNTGATEVDPAFGRIAGPREVGDSVARKRQPPRPGRRPTVSRPDAPRRRRRPGLRLHRPDGLALAHGHPRAERLRPRAGRVGPKLEHAASRRVWTRAGPDRQLSRTPRSPARRTRRCTAVAGTIWERSGSAAPNGQYKVTLKFCEPHFNAAGERICDVQLQGRTVLDESRHLRPGRQVRRAGLHLRQRRRHRRRADHRTRRPQVAALHFRHRGRRPRLHQQDQLRRRRPTRTGRPMPGSRAACPATISTPTGRRPTSDWRKRGKVFAAIDGKVPQVTDGGCPSGRLTPVTTPWSSVAPQFAFVDEFEKLRPRVRGAGNLDRFDYWLNTFKYHRSLAQLRCALAKPDAGGTRAPLGRRLPLSAGDGEHARRIGDGGQHGEPSRLGPGHCQAHRQPWPKEYQGTPRLIVPTVRSIVIGRNADAEDHRARPAAGEVGGVHVHVRWARAMAEHPGHAHRPCRVMKRSSRRHRRTSSITSPNHRRQHARLARHRAATEPNRRRHGMIHESTRRISHPHHQCGLLAQTIVCPPDAPANVKLAAKEIRRYVYLRTGELLPMAETGKRIALKVDPDARRPGIPPEVRRRHAHDFRRQRRRPCSTAPTRSRRSSACASRSMAT